MKKFLLSSLLIANGVAIAAPFVVKEIRVDGVEPDTQSNIIATLPVKVGQTATDSDLTKIVRTLFVQNRFQDVRAIREGNTLVVKVAERPTIGSVDIEGNKAIPKDPLQQNLKANFIMKGEVFDANKLEGFKQALLEHYKSIGRNNAKIETITTTAANNHINIKLQIDEGDVSYVKTIDFEGNHAFTRKELIKQLDIKPDVSWWNIFESSKYELPVFNKDIEALRNFYLNHGYAKYQLNDAKVKFSDDKKDVALTYQLTEGEKYNISAIRIIGNTANMDDELNTLLKDFKPGQQFRGDEMATIEEGIKEKLGNNGYSSAKVDLIPTFNEQENTVLINFVVDAGKRMYVRKIRFEGNDVTADSTLRREMRQQEGTWISTKNISLGKSRLERTGFYESVEMLSSTVPNTDDQVDIIYRIKERNTGSINFGIGYGSESGISYQAGIKQDNFLGMGSSISLNGQRTDYGTSLNLGYTEPYFTKDGVSLGGNVFYDDYNNSKQKSAASYARTTYGISGTLGFPVNENNSYYLGLGYTHDKLKNIQREYNREIYVRSMKFPYQGNVYPKMKTDDFDFSFGWNYNSLNRGFMPTEGTTASLGGKVTIPGSDNRYYKLNASFSNYLPLNREHKWVISTRLGLGYANGIGGKKLPFFQTYTAGGIGSVRGFSYGSIGPNAIYRTDKDNFTSLSSDIVGGNAIATASVELIMPTPFVNEKSQHLVRTSLFVDAGTVWNTNWSNKSEFDRYAEGPNQGKPFDLSTLTGYQNYGDYKRFRASTGLAFQWNSPIGPLIFSYAKPIRKYKNDEIEQFQFSIGGSF